MFVACLCVPVYFLLDCVFVCLLVCVGVSVFVRVSVCLSSRACVCSFFCAFPLCLFVCVRESE